jgi:mRNA interferase YafQ
MLNPVYTTRFEKDLKRVRKRGSDVSKIKAAIILLINEKPLDVRMKDHLLIPF